MAFLLGKLRQWLALLKREAQMLRVAVYRFVENGQPAKVGVKTSSPRRDAISLDAVKTRERNRR